MSFFDKLRKKQEKVLLKKIEKAKKEKKIRDKFKGLKSELRKAKGYDSDSNFGKSVGKGLLSVGKGVVSVLETASKNQKKNMYGKKKGKKKNYELDEGFF